LAFDDIDAAAADALTAQKGFFPSTERLPDGDPAALLRDLEIRYRALIDRLPAVIYIDSIDPGTPMVDVSCSVETTLGIAKGDWLADPDALRAAIHPEDLDRVIQERSRAIEDCTPVRMQYRVRHAEGHELWVREERVPVRDDHGAPLYWLGLMLDVTELALTQQELEETQTKFGALVEQIPAIVYIDLADEEMSTTYVSPQIATILGYSPQEYIDDPELWTEMLHPDDRPEALETYLRGRESGEPFVFEYRLIARDGTVVWFRDSAIVLPDAYGRPQFIQGVMLDITERKAAEEQIAYLAYHDKLTGLPNRVMFDELLDLSLARARRNDEGVAVVSIDLDDFKLVNDSLGHEAGDELIRQLAERLRDATRDTDLVARPGGDEFLVLLADLDLASPVPGGHNGASISAEAVAVRVQEALKAPFEVGGTELYVTASQGISAFPIDAEDPTGLLQNADTAMFTSKKAGPGGYVVHTHQHADAVNRLSMSTRLRKAVEQKQWTLHYQPLIELASGQMYGVEALIRWPEPNGGLVPPGEFIPLAEEMGLIEAIGDWVVEEICRQDAQWRAEGLTLEIGFNLSPRQLWQPELVDKIVSPIVVAGMDPTRVTVEITESTAMTDPDRTVELLAAIHERGLKLAIDDFGTGYSSLARLRHMPVDILKIDRSFIRDLDKDEDAASMVTAMISLASNLGMSSLAEGIETPGEWHLLVERGCELGQGYYFSRPVPAAEILAIHRRAALRVIDGEATA
jgi:diguanylate cyclase (GGDEF)-like protein/PAS domain S-box-containing protein